MDRPRPLFIFLYPNAVGARPIDRLFPTLMESRRLPRAYRSLSNAAEMRSARRVILLERFHFFLSRFCD